MTDLVDASSLILVTGATGRQGGALARRLAARGRRVRALTRRPDGAAPRSLAALGVEVSAGGMEDRLSLDRALPGVSRVFAVQNFWEGGFDAEVRQGRNLVDAAKAAGVEHFVQSSVASADQARSVPHFRSKHVVEEHLVASGLSRTVLRPAAFMDDLEAERDAVVRDGALSLPLRPDARYKLVAVADIAAVAAMALDEPERWRGRIVLLVGDDLGAAETAAVLSRVTGRPVRYHRSSWEEVERALGAELAAMFRFFDAPGLEGSPDALRAEHPGLLDFERYLCANGWVDAALAAAAVGQGGRA